jgi:hypothetical protein
VDPREERIARNEVLFREVNERVRQVSDDPPRDEIEFLCECGRLDCTKSVALTRGEYEEIRADPMLFAVVPGHEILDVEDVVADRDRYFIVRKHEEQAGIARGSDPRG